MSRRWRRNCRSRCWKPGFTRVGEFHYLHHGIDGTPYADTGGDGLAPRGRRRDQWHRPDAAAGVLCPWRLRRAAPGPGQRRFLTDPNRFARLMEASRAAVAGLPDAVVGHGTTFAARRDAGAELADDPAAGRGRPDPHPCGRADGRGRGMPRAGPASGRWPGCSTHAPVSERWCLIHATHMTDDEAAAMARSGAVAGLCPITEANLGDGTFNGSRSWRRAALTASAATPNVLIDLRRRAAPARILPAPAPPRPQRAGHGRPAGHGPGAVRCGRGRRRSRTGCPGGSAPGRTGRYRDPRRGAPSPCRPQRRRATRQPGLRCREPNHP